MLPALSAASAVGCMVFVWKSRLELIFAAAGEVITSGLFRRRGWLSLHCRWQHAEMIDLRLGP